MSHFTKCALKMTNLLALKNFEIDGDLANADIGLALRDAGGYPAQHWKSNCKLANLQPLGIPALCSPESGYQEAATGAEVWVQEPKDLVQAFDRLEPFEKRLSVRSAMLTTKTTLEKIAETNRGWLCALVS